VFEYEKGKALYLVVSALYGTVDSRCFRRRVGRTRGSRSRKG